METAATKTADTLESVELAGWKLPGTCALSATPDRVRITERIRTREELLELWRIMPVIQDGTGRGLSVSNPALDMMGIHSVVLLGVTMLHPSEIKGVFEMEYDLRPVKAP